MYNNFESFDVMVNFSLSSWLDYFPLLESFMTFFNVYIELLAFCRELLIEDDLVLDNIRKEKIVDRLKTLILWYGVFLDLTEIFLELFDEHLLGKFVAMVFNVEHHS